MSSKEIRFTAEQALQPRQKIEVAVNWPALLDSTCLMKLVVSGRVVWSNHGSLAVAIEHYEFHTRAASRVAICAPPATASAAGA